jgi:hypothetical protein
MDQISCLHLPVTKAQVGLTSARLESFEERGSSGRINSIREKHDSVESECEKLRSASTLRSRKLVPFSLHQRLSKITVGCLEESLALSAT